MPPSDDATTTSSAIGERRQAAKAGRGENYHDRRNEIIRTAATLFKAKGYQGTSVGDIAAALETDRATLYYYVGSKAEIFDELVTDLVMTNVRAAEAFRDGDGPPADRLRRLIVELMESYAEHYPFLYVYLQENLAHVDEARQGWAKRMRRANRRWEAAVEAIVQQGIDGGSFRPLGDAKLLSYGIIGTVSWTNRWFTPSAELDAIVIGETYADLLLRGLAA